MLTCKGWDAWISGADGQEIVQYKITTEESSSILPQNLHVPHITSKMSCWIASEEGRSSAQEFNVHVVSKAPTSISRISIYMDGVYVTGRVIRPGVTEHKISGRKSLDLRTEAPFLFSRLSLSDDDSALRDVSHLKDLGIIRISIDRVAMIPGPAPPMAADSRSIAEKGPVHEASKKAGAHCVSYGNSRAVMPMSYINVRPLDEKPYLEFEFRYRSADMLRAQDIMPPAPIAKVKNETTTRPPKRQRAEESAAGPSVPKRNVKQEQENEEDVDDEIRALREKLKSLEKRRNKENKATLPTKKAKVESLNYPKFVDEEIIDLTQRPKKKAKVEPLDYSNFVDGEVIDLT